MFFVRTLIIVAIFAIAGCSSSPEGPQQPESEVKRLERVLFGGDPHASDANYARRWKVDSKPGYVYGCGDYKSWYINFTSTKWRKNEIEHALWEQPFEFEPGQVLIRPDTFFTFTNYIQVNSGRRDSILLVRIMCPARGSQSTFEPRIANPIRFNDTLVEFAEYYLRLDR